MNHQDRFEKIELSHKEKLIEFLSVSMAALLIIACVLKVLFF